MPTYLRVNGEILMGNAPSFDIKPGETALIHTGGMLPESCNAVVMIEYTQQVGEGTVEVLRSVAAGENIIKVGEDVQSGEEVIPAGVRIRPAEIGGLAALGILELAVSKPVIESYPVRWGHLQKANYPGGGRHKFVFVISIIEQAGANPKDTGFSPIRRDPNLCVRALTVRCWLSLPDLPPARVT
jgi:hypothetical protein